VATQDSASGRPYRLEICGQPVDYVLCRSRRRTIGLSVDHRGLRVGAPQRATLKDIEALLHKHGKWVLDKLARWQDKPATAPLQDGSTFPWLGAPVTLRQDALSKRVCWQEQTLKVPATLSLETALLRAIKPKARTYLQARLEIWAARMGLPLPPLFLSSARTRWGSCNSKGEIRLSWRLMHFEPALIDYVVVHELAHLKEMNHSPRFWSVVEAHFPDWRQARTALRRLAPELPVY